MTNLSRVIAFLLFFLIITLVNAAEPCININTAPKEELEKIKHIGEARAEQIIKLRSEKLFSSVDELDRVVGIGPARISDIKEQGLACVSDYQPATTTNPPVKIITQEEILTQEEVKPQKIYPNGIIINEILPSPLGPDSEEEWIELYNKNNFEVDISGWKIYDTFGSMTAYIFSEGTKIKQKGFLTLGRPESKITLNNSLDGLSLAQPDGNVINNISYKNAKRGQSLNLIKNEWIWSSALTPGSANILAPIAEKKETNASLDEKQLASVGEQLPEYKNSLLPVLAAGILAVISGVAILFIKNKTKGGLE